MKKQLIRISILQSSKIITALYALMGLVHFLIGVPLIILGDAQLRFMGIIYVLMPVILAVVGFIFFVIFAWLYNFLARRFGGFEVEIKNIA